MLVGTYSFKSPEKNVKHLIIATYLLQNLKVLKTQYLKYPFGVLIAISVECSFVKKKEFHPNVEATIAGIPRLALRPSSHGCYKSLRETKTGRPVLRTLLRKLWLNLRIFLKQFSFASSVKVIANLGTTK